MERFNSSNRFYVTYIISARYKEAKEIAKDICYEQTVEVTKNLVCNKWIKNNIVGKIEKFETISKNKTKVIISYAGEITSFRISHFLNVIFGNISIKTRIRITNIDFGDAFLSHFSGPKFGIYGIRKILNIYNRPLLGAVLKPLGETPKQLAKLVYQFALGKIDIIKDDHGICNQSFCPFKDRVTYCMKSIKKAEDKTGKRVLYFPNIMEEHARMLTNAKFAKRLGVGGFLFSPALAGYDFIKKLVDETNLPVMVHPSFTGTFFNDPEHGINQDVLLGTIMRLAGSDFVIYPNFGGRFNFSKQVCLSIAKALLSKLGNLNPSWPVPAGGFNAEKIPELTKLYGENVVFLIGSRMQSKSSDLSSNVKYFHSLIQKGLMS
jgi:ribulose-bisphosphate carboxylase large chain